VLFLAGGLTSLALAGNPPGVGHGHNHGRGASGSTTEATVTVTTTTVTVTTTTAAAPDKLLVLCHRTGSSKYPYEKVNVPANAVWMRVKHGDLLPGPSGTCPSSVGAKASRGKSH